MQRSRLIIACVPGTMFVVGWVSLGTAEEQQQAPIHQYSRLMGSPQEADAMNTRGMGLRCGREAS